jgi:hypothetical protein
MPVTEPVEGVCAAKRSMHANVKITTARQTLQPGNSPQYRLIEPLYIEPQLRRGVPAYSFRLWQKELKRLPSS